MTPRRSVSNLVIALALAISACGTVDTDPVGNGSDDPPASALPAVPDPGCPDRLDEAAALLSSGLPTYDYDPATSVAELVGRTDLAVTGTLHAVERVLIESDEDPGGDAATVVSAVDVDVLAGDGPPPADFDFSSFWATGQGPDPLQDAIELIDVRFVAFLHGSSRLTGWSVDVQGLFVACDDEPLERIIEPAPPDAGGTIDDLIAAVRSATEGPVPLVRQLLGVQYYGACGNELLHHDDETWYPFHDTEQSRFGDDTHERAVGAEPSASVHGLVRVPAPSPGDDTGTLFVYSDGLGRFISDSGRIDLWMTTDEQIYDWEC